MYGAVNAPKIKSSQTNILRNPSDAFGSQYGHNSQSLGLFK
jgi:hypothetical protein